MNKKNYKQKRELVRSEDSKLADLRREILVEDPEKALGTILDHPFPVTLVQSFTPEDLYILIHRIGPDDALPVLALASNRQWQYVIDMEAWQGDQIDNHSLTEWFNRLLQADPDRFGHWIFNQQIDTFRFYLFKNIELRIRQHDQDPSELGPDFFSDDETFYIRFQPFAGDTPDKEKFQQLRDQFLTDVLRRISVLDHIKFQGLLLEADSLIPAEAEEELYRLRNIRLAEQGLLPYEEAVGIYQHLSVENLFTRQPKSIRTSHPPGTTSELVPVISQQQLESDNLFIRTLEQIQDQAVFFWLQSEFAGLCNQIISADKVKIRDQAVLAEVVVKARDYLAIALEKITLEYPGRQKWPLEKVLQTFLLVDIFRVGYGCALEVKWDAEKWVRNSWFRKNGLPLSFWDEYWLGVLGGLLLKKPLFFDNFATGVIYREFSSLEEIKNTALAVQGAMAFDDLLALLEARPPIDQHYGHLTYKNLLLTLWADHYLGLATGKHRPVALKPAHLQSLYRDLWTGSDRPRKIGNEIKTVFLDWLADRAVLAPEAISRRLGHLLEDLFNEIEAELGTVDQDNLDPRFITLFLMAK